MKFTINTIKLLKQSNSNNYYPNMSSRLSYQYDEFIKYKYINEKMPQQLISYCSDYARASKLDIDNYKDIMNDIIASIKKGDNPNDVVFRNYIKHYINTINQPNYNDFLGKLKALDFSSVKNVQFLASELIISAIRYPISIKGFTFNEDPKYKSPPEICADVAKYFSALMVKTEERNIGFHDELLKICQHFFLDFLNLNKALDENNVSTSDNYKGFMTFMGLLYSRGILNIKIVIDCIDKIKRNIFCSDSNADVRIKHVAEHSCVKHICKMYGPSITTKSVVESICFFDCNQNDSTTKTSLITKRKHTECINLYKGYEHLINHVIHSLELKINDLCENINNNNKSLIKYETLLNTIDSKPDSPIILGFILNKPINLLLPERTEDKIIKSFDDFTNIFDSKKEAYDAIKNIFEVDYKNIQNNISMFTKSIYTLYEYLDIIIKSHQEIITYNQYYKSMNKNQLITPFKPHIIITHNSIGQNLNKLCEKLSVFNDKFTTRYTTASIIKTTD